MTIIPYTDQNHRTGLIELWKNVFNYADKRNDPALAIDKKRAVDDGLLFVALENSALIGSVMGGYDGHRGWIYSLAVDAAFRNRGIGSALLQHIEKELKLRGSIKINLQVLARNGEVVEFYRRNGFKVEERICMGKEILENISE